MSIGLGQNAWLGFAPESVYGTAVASTKFIEVQKENFKGEQGRVSKPSLRRVSQDHRVRKKVSVTGGFEAQFSYDGLELLLKHALGTNNTTGAGPYTHTMSGAAALPVGLTFHVNRDAAAVGVGSAFVYKGCQIQKLTLKQEAEDFLMLAAEILGKDFANENIETPTFPTFSGADWEDFACTIGGSAVAVESMELNIENTLAAERYKLGQLTRKGLGRAGNRKITGSVTLEFEQLTEYTRYKDLTAAAIVFTWTGPAGTSLTITLPVCEFTAGDPEVADAGPIKLKLDFEAYMTTTDGDEISLVLINNVATIA